MEKIYNKLGPKKYLEFVDKYLDYMNTNSKVTLINFLKKEGLSWSDFEGYSTFKTLYKGIVYDDRQELRDYSFASWSSDFKVAENFAMMRLDDLRDINGKKVEIYSSKGEGISLNKISTDIMSYLYAYPNPEVLVEHYLEGIDGCSLDMYKEKILPTLSARFRFEEKEFIMPFLVNKVDNLKSFHVGGIESLFYTQAMEELDLKILEGTDLPIQTKDIVEGIETTELKTMYHNLLTYNRNNNKELIRESLDTLLKGTKIENLKEYRKVYLVAKEGKTIREHNAYIFNTNINLAVNRGLGLANQYSFSKHDKIRIITTTVRGFLLEDLYAEIVRELLTREELSETNYLQFADRMVDSIAGIPISQAIVVGETNSQDLYERVHRTTIQDGMHIIEDEEIPTGKLFEMAYQNDRIKMYEIDPLKTFSNAEEYMTKEYIRFINYKMSKLSNDLSILELIENISDWQSGRSNTLLKYLWTKIDKEVIEPYITYNNKYRKKGKELNSEGKYYPTIWYKNKDLVPNLDNSIRKNVYGLEEEGLKSDTPLTSIIVNNGVGIDLGRLIFDLRVWAQYGNSDKGVANLILSNILPTNHEIISLSKEEGVYL